MDSNSKNSFKQMLGCRSRIWNWNPKNMKAEDYITIDPVLITKMNLTKGFLSSEDGLEMDSIQLKFCGGRPSIPLLAPI